MFNCKLTVNNAKTRALLDKQNVKFNVIIKDGICWIYVTEKDAIRYLKGELA